MKKQNIIYRWIQTGQSQQSKQSFIKFKQIDCKNQKVELQNKDGKIIIFPLQQTYQASFQDNFNDMCQMSILNEPQILNNIQTRFYNKKIFTNIGSTLLIVNPYQVIEQLFGKGLIEFYKNLVLGNENNNNLEKYDPHIYLLAGKAYKQLIAMNKKQTIIISGQSGAGKTQSTKFCLQFITSLSHVLQQHTIQSIQDKILKCNPILEAFGNSKTVRNDNSSRFGKFIQVFFDHNKNIMGAKIKSYLLQKSRVIALQKNQRNYHCFYALTASKKYQSKQAKNYSYLSKSNCYTANNINDLQYFKQINEAMKIVGFSQIQIDKIWQILKCILEIGNLQIDDTEHQKNQDQPCKIKNKEELNFIGKILKIKNQQLQFFLLYERRKFLKQFLLTPYNKQSCQANIDSLSKELYSRTFQFIISKTNQLIRPKNDKKSNSNVALNILDIFGFQNFQKNSFQQICINFTNQKLLNLYNRYIFQRQIQLLKQDGLVNIVQGLSPPNNNDLLALVSSNKLSVFSIINDLTPHQQYKDEDILYNLKKQLNETNNLIIYPKQNSKLFTIRHSQCDVNYSIEGFQIKNKDKIKQQIVKMTQNIFQQKNKIKSNINKDGKTLLAKFTDQINTLMIQLQSSNVHFIRCLKPNNNKKPNQIDSKYLLNQIRYLGIFQTIKIRQKIFPFRRNYEEFKKHYYQLFYSKSITVEDAIKKLSKNKNQYILGKKRIYLSPQFQLNLKKQKQIIIQCVRKIQKQFKTYKFRKIVFKNLKNLKKLFILKKYSIKNILYVKKQVFKTLVLNLNFQRLKSTKSQSNKLKSQINEKKINKRKQQIKLKLFKTLMILQKLQKFTKLSLKRATFKKIKEQVTQKLKQKIQQKIDIQEQFNLKDTQQLKQNYNSLTNYDSVKTIIDENQKPYYNQKRQIKKKNSTLLQNKKFTFPNQFINYNSVLRNQEQQILFKYNLHVPLFQYQSDKAKLKKLVSSFKKKQFSDDRKQLKQSKFIYFNTSDLDRLTYNKLLSFDEEVFCQKYLRKRSKLMGKKKSFNQIFSAKRKPLQKSLSRMEQIHEQFSLKIFKQILRIYHQGGQQFILRVIQIFLSLLYETPQQIINQTFLQLLKQINSDKQEDCIKTHRIILSFLHFFRPSEQFLIVGLYIFFQRMECHMYSNDEESFLRLSFQKTYKKYKSDIDTKYKPSKYQLYCLICKRMFPFNFFLSVGSSVQVHVQSDQTFAEIKPQILQKFGINTERINPKYFAFFQIITFQQGQMQQIPICDNDLVWDVKSYWQIAKSRYNQHDIQPPKFYILVKIKFPFELFSFDYEGIQILYSQCFFDYFTGKVRVADDCLIQLAWLIMQIKGLKFESQKKNSFIYSIFPLWALRKYGDMILQKSLKSFYQDNKNKLKDHQELSQTDFYQLKFNFIKVLQKFPLTMSIAIPPQNDLLADSSLLYYLKPRRFYVVQKQNMQILQEYELKKLISWQVDSQKLSFVIKQQGGSNNTKTHIFYTQYAQLFSDYLNEIGQLSTMDKNKKS